MFEKLVTTCAILVATGTALSAQTTATETVEESALSEEAAAWEAVKGSETSGDVFAFIERFPNGEFTKEAKARMIDLLWVEMAASGPTPVTEEETQQDVVPVTFNTPLTLGAPDIVGKTLAELIEGSPLFPPIEGLPEEYWKTQECSNCHEWEQANLCTQANSYVSVAGAENLTKQHPYGGTFKLNLRNWALEGCE
jgi:hypothetical protein